jgi:hypothetical protein
MLANSRAASPRRTDLKMKPARAVGIVPAIYHDTVATAPASFTVTFLEVEIARFAAKMPVLMQCFSFSFVYKFLLLSRAR